MKTNFLLNLLMSGTHDWGSTLVNGSTTVRQRPLNGSTATRWLASLICVLMLTIGSGNVWGATYTITFKTASSDPSTAISTSETITNIVSEGSSNIKSLNTCTKCYGPAISGLKLGTGSATGTFKFTLSDALAAKTIRSVTVKTVAYGTDGGNITGTATGTNAGSLGTIAKGTDLVKDYTASSTTKITTIQVATSTKRAYISQIIIETIEATPTLTVSPSSITSGLTYVYGSGPSSAQTFTVSGSNLTANVTVSAPTNFEVSKDGSSYAASQTITASGTLSATTIYVRLKSGLAVNSYSGNITVASTGATSKTVSLSGSVTAPSYTVGWSITSGGGTLSTTSGMSTTVTPASGYRYASPAYTVLTGAATVVQSTNTFTATPTANSTIRINMEEIPSHTLSFNTGGLVTIPSVSVLEGATYNITQTPASSLSGDCEYSTFVGWTTASSIADPSVKPSIVTSITMSTSDVTLYAVYSKTTGGSGASVGATIFAEDFSSYSSGNVPSGSVTTNSNGRTVYGDANVTYACVDGSSNTKIYAETIAGGTSPELLVGKSGGSFSIDGIPSGEATTLTLSFRKNNKTFTPSVTGTGYSIGSISGSNPYSYTITVGSASTFKLTLTPGSDNVRLDDISITVATTSNAGTTSYSMSANCNMPKITINKTAIEFGDKKVGGTYTETFTVSGENLTGAINLAVSGAQSGKYSVSPTTLSPTAGTVGETTITVTFAPTASADHRAQVDITSDGATTKTVSLKAYSKWEVTWLKNGEDFTTTLVAGGQRPTFPTPNPTSCDGTSTTFRGWTQTPWSGKQSQSYVDGLTTDATKVYLDNTTMPTVSSNNVVYHAVFAKATGSDESDVINYSATSSNLDGESTSAYVSNFTITGSTGAQYRIHSMGTGDGIALRWNSNGYLYCSSAPTSGAKLSSVTITTTADKNIGVYASTSAYSGDTKPTATSLGTVTATSSGATKNITADTYSYIGLVGTATSTIISSITITYGGTSYSDYLTNCCNTPTLAFAASPYAVIRQDIGGASTTTWATVDVTFTSNNTTGEISTPDYDSPNEKNVYKLSTWEARATTGGTLCGRDHAYFEVLTQPSGETPGTGRFHVKTTTGQTGQGTYRIAITQEGTDESHGNYCETTVYGFIDVTLRDKFVDVVNGNGTVNRDGHGAQLATPILSEFDTQEEDECHSEGRKLKGWIKETDLSDYSGDKRVTVLDSSEGGFTNRVTEGTKIIAPGTSVTMTGVTWYAVWAYEK